MYLVIERLLREWFLDNQCLRRGGVRDVLLSLGTFLIVTLTWIPFRASDWSAFSQVLRGLFRWDFPMQLELIMVLVSLTAIVVTVRWHFALRDRSLEEEFGRWGTLVQTGVVAICLIAVFLCSGGDERAFIYFQF